MQSIREARQLTAALIALRAGGKSLALVPTMGALHAGHLALIEEARRKADRVVATIFVNPLQFGANEDLGRYPRQEEKDAAMLAEARCDLLWLPSLTRLLHGMANACPRAPARSGVHIPAGRRRRKRESA